MTPNNVSKEIGDPRNAAQTFRSLLQLAIAGLFIGALLLREANLPFVVIGLCVVLLLWLIIKTNATPLLVTFQLIMLFREPNRRGLEEEFDSALYVAVVLGLLMFLSRDQSLKGLIRRTLTELIKTFAGTQDKARRTIAVQPNRPPAMPTSHPATAFFRQIVLLLVCVLVSQLLLTIFGIVGGIADEIPSVTHAEKLLKPVPLLLIITVVAVIVTSELAWRRLTPGQSSMYLRTTQVTLHYADIRMIVKRRLSRLRRKQPVSTTAESA